MRRLNQHGMVGLVALGSLLLAQPAWAQPRGPSTQPSASVPGKGTTSPEKLEEARLHYDRGVKLFGDGAVDAARAEFERAYKLAPTYKLLYNLGLVYEQQGDFVGALKNFERYLAEGGQQVPAERRAEVTEEMNKLRPRIAVVRIKLNVPDAELFIDDADAGKYPENAVLNVNPGRRKISAQAPGRIPAAKVIDVTGSDNVQVSLDLSQQITRTIVIERKRRVPWAGWIATGVLAAGTGVFGYLALKWNSKLNDDLEVVNQDPEKLHDDRVAIKRFSTTADILAVTTLVAGGVSLFYTIKWANEKDSEAVPGADTGAQAKHRKPHAPPLVDVGPGGISVQGTF